ncbi:MAG: DUF6986 family protein [Archangium sp.]
MSMLDETFWASFRAGLGAEHRAFVAKFPGESGERQPVSVLYGGAQLFKAETPAKLGALAMKAFDEFAAPDFAGAFGFETSLAQRVMPRVKAKLEREPIEDLRIDFEDGFGHRSDAEEDAVAVTAGRELAKCTTVPPFIGIRVKPMTEELGVRAIRTLELFLGELPKLPKNFVVTLPKVTSAGQVKLFVQALDALQANVKLEVMVEAAQGLEDLPKLVSASRGRLRGAHFGTYDYTASLGIAANEQRMQHPACDDAKWQMQRAFAGTGVWLSDGATTSMPIAKAGREAVHAAWRKSVSDTRHSLSGGFYQGWDLHPAQLVSRYAAVYAFFLENLEASTKRLRNFVDKLAQATTVGTTFDDAATGQGLLNFFLRGHACGALSDDDVSATGLTKEELASKSFASIAKNRRQA